MLESPQISLLWPGGFEARSGEHLEKNTAANLDLESTIQALAAEYHNSQDIRAVLLHLCDDLATIQYRQDILEDLLTFPRLVQGLERVLSQIGALDRFGYLAAPDQTPLHEVAWRVGQLEHYVECVLELSAVFQSEGHSVRSEGLRQLRALTQQIVNDETFQNLVAELPEIVTQVRSIASVTIGVNLDDQLRPVEATLLSINRKKFKGISFSLINILMGRDDRQNEWEGIAPLHSVPRQNASFQSFSNALDFHDPMLYPLFRDLSQVLKQISRPIAAVLQRYIRIQTGFLSLLGTELGFYLGAVRLIERIQATGLPMCKPELTPKEDRVCELTDTYNVNLALRLSARNRNVDLRQVIITNDITFGSDSQVFVLTGPNQGGKTTFTQAVGLVQILAQAGLYVPGSRARISPVDGIYTHFPSEERPETEAGRLGEEAQRFADIFARATPYSLILLNESLSSTSYSESLYLARDILRILMLLGARVIYTTHLHELAADLDELNAAGGNKAVSLVSLVEEGPGANGSSIQRTYRIVPGPPLGHSYARELAARYGISYEQLLGKLRQRGVVNGDGTEDL